MVDLLQEDDGKRGDKECGQAHEPRECQTQSFEREFGAEGAGQVTDVHDARQRCQGDCVPVATLARQCCCFDLVHGLKMS